MQQESMLYGNCLFNPSDAKPTRSAGHMYIKTARINDIVSTLIIRWRISVDRWHKVNIVGFCIQPHLYPGSLGGQMVKFCVHVRDTHSTVLQQFSEFHMMAHCQLNPVITLTSPWVLHCSIHCCCTSTGQRVVCSLKHIRANCTVAGSCEHINKPSDSIISG